MKEQTWIDAQDKDFLDALQTVVHDFGIAVRQNVEMIQLFNQYGMLLNIIITPDVAVEDDNLSNTNLPEQPAPANRAEKRAAAKRKTPLDIANKRK